MLRPADGCIAGSHRESACSIYKSQKAIPEEGTVPHVTQHADATSTPQLIKHALVTPLTQAPIGGSASQHVGNSFTLRAVHPAASITVTLAFTLLNSGIALIGYYFTAALIDYIHWGRVRIQVRRIFTLPAPSCNMWRMADPHQDCALHISTHHPDVLNGHGSLTSSTAANIDEGPGVVRRSC